MVKQSTLWPFAPFNYKEECFISKRCLYAVKISIYPSVHISQVLYYQYRERLCTFVYIMSCHDKIKLTQILNQSS